MLEMLELPVDNDNTLSEYERPGFQILRRRKCHPEQGFVSDKDDDANRAGFGSDAAQRFLDPAERCTRHP